LELNQRPIGYEPTALTSELQAHFLKKFCKKHPILLIVSLFVSFPYFIVIINGGREGIRTLEAENQLTPLAGEPFKPLRHPSREIIQKVLQRI
jgi:hypothetical protein